MNPNEPTWSGPNRLRTSDKEREQVAEILRAAMTEGRLNLEEGEERLAAVYAAKYRDELGPLTADLPGNGRPALADTPEARAAMRRMGRRHAAGAVGGMVVLLALLTGLALLPGPHFFFFFPLMFLFFALAGRRRRAHYYHHYHHGGDWSQPVAPWNRPDYR